MKTTIFRWLITKLDPVLSNLGYIRVKEPLKPGTTVLKFTDRDILFASVHKVLHANLSTDSPAVAETITDVANQVVAEITATSGLTVADQMKRYHHDILASRQITYVLGCGVAAYWELSVKQLAEKLKIPVFEEDTSKKKKSPGLRKLEPIIDDIKTAVPKLEILITKRKNLRDALIHGNFHQLKTHTRESKPRAMLERLQGSVWRLNLKDDSIEQLSEIQTLEKIREAGLFAWFLEVASSEVLEHTITELKNSIDDLQALISLHAMCFNERKGLFEKMFVRGERLAEGEVSLFYKEENKEHIDKMFSKLNAMIKI